MDAMLDEIGVEGILGWVAYSTLEPFGEVRADLRAGIVASAIVNVHRGKKSDPVSKPTDFMPDFSKAAKKTADRKPVTDQQTWTSIKAMAKAVAIGMSKPKGKRELRNENRRNRGGTHTT